MKLTTLLEHTNNLTQKIAEVSPMKDEMSEQQAIKELLELRDALRDINHKVRHIDLNKLKHYDMYSDLYRQLHTLVDHNNIISGHISVVTSKI